MTIQAITFYVGQPVPWHQSPSGIAQVEDLLRSNVQLLWVDDAGRLRRRRVNVGKVNDYAERNPFLIFVPDNPYNRGIVRLEKTFEL